MLRDSVRRSTRDDAVSGSQMDRWGQEAEDKGSIRGCVSLEKAVETTSTHTGMTACVVRVSLTIVGNISRGYERDIKRRSKIFALPLGHPFITTHPSHL